jgi:hypothetical protein
LTVDGPIRRYRPLELREPIRRHETTGTLTTDWENEAQWTGRGAWKGTGGPPATAGPSLNRDMQGPATGMTVSKGLDAT